LVAIEPDNKAAAEAKLRYFELSGSLTELFEAKDRYPSVEYDVEKRSAELIATFSDLEKYRNRIGKTTQYDNYIFDKLYSKLTLYDLCTLIGFYPNAKSNTDAKRVAIDKCSTMDDITSIKDYHATLPKELEAEASLIVLANKETAIKNFNQFVNLFPNSSLLYKDGITLQLGGQQGTGKALPDGGAVRQIAYTPETAYQVGDFYNGELQCYDGIEVYADERYRGGFSNGRYHGQGTFTSSKYTYTGSYVNGDRQGSGKMCGERPLYFFARGCSDCKSACYDGTWSSNWPSGQGRLFSSDEKTWYEGGFKNGDFHGQGVLRIEGMRIYSDYNEGNPGGETTVKQWTLLGLISAEESVYASTWDQVIQVVKRVASAYGRKLNGSDSSRSSRNDEDDNRRKREEQAKESQKKAQNEREEIEECINDLEKDLKDFYGSDPLLDFTCPCVVQHDDSWFGTNFKLIHDKNGKYWYNVGGMFTSDQGPYDTRLKALSEGCKDKLD
jgi:hypothetical protein